MTDLSLSAPAELTDDQMLRYSRHILLDGLDYEGQQRLLASTVMIIGLGGLGCPVALYLAASGVGHIVLVDPDRVELSNLQRQIAHKTADIGAFKVESVRNEMALLNPELVVECFPLAADAEWLMQHLDGVDLLLDCSDRAAVRYQINQACLQTATPWVSAAAVGFNGQITSFHPGDIDSPCYRCLYPALDSDDGAAETLACAESGVLAPLVGVVGSLQASLAVNILAGLGANLKGRLQTLDLRTWQWRQWHLPRVAGCSDCGIDCH